MHGSFGVVKEGDFIVIDQTDRSIKANSARITNYQADQDDALARIDDFIQSPRHASGSRGGSQNTSGFAPYTIRVTIVENTYEVSLPLALLQASWPGKGKFLLMSTHT